MTRAPTPHDTLYAWHRQALENISLHLLIDVTPEPQPGWFKRRLVKGGPYVPAKIWMYQPTDDSSDLIGDEVLQYEVNGRHADPEEAWSWLCGDPISEAQFNYMIASLQWSADYAPDEPMAKPQEKIDWMKVPVPTF